MIRLENLQVRAGEFSLALDELRVAPGEYLMVLGPTASGKTVLLETLAGLRRPRAGRVHLNGRDVTGEPPERRRVGLVYQDYALFPHLTVGENIGFGIARSSRGATARARTRELAALLGIEQLLERHPEGLSGGEQQRVALARALATQPDVLLLDEPLSALDGPTRLELRRELARLHRELRTTVVHVTHDLDEAMALGDTVAVLMAGRLRQIGAPAEVTRHPADVGVAALVGISNVFRLDEERSSCVTNSEADECVTLSLECGLDLRALGLPPRPRGAGCAVIRPEEIDVLPLGGDADGTGRRGWRTGEAGTDNLLEGTVRTVQLQSVHALLEVEVVASGRSQGQVFTVNVLRPQVERMGLASGSRVTLLIPGAAVQVCAAETQDPPR